MSGHFLPPTPLMHPVPSALDISRKLTAVSYSLRAYFQNMTTFSLFYQPGFQSKLAALPSNLEAAALVASIFIFSSRFLQDEAKRGGYPLLQQDVDPLPTPEVFHALARRYIDNTLEECAEDSPSLCVLQAIILCTFHQLSQDVRGLAWRSLGICIRIAYEINLHKIDSERVANQSSHLPYEKDKWVQDEERRRAWWAVWELDAFASTIRRLPTGLDSTQIETFLPVSDEAWFSATYQPSCCLDLDPKARWKLLEKCANHSWKAWYIVLNSMMLDAHILSYSRGTQGTDSPRSTSRPSASGSASICTKRDGLRAIEESLSSFAKALPKQLSYRNEYLLFHSPTSMESQSTLAHDCATHSLYMMRQLTSFMINHCQMFWEGPPAEATSSAPQADGSSANERRRPMHSISIEAWNRYLESADNILHMIRNSSPYHVRYVNPLFASTIWIAAVAQVVSKVFNPEPSNAQTAQCKLEVLQHNFDSYVSFWGTSRALQQKLNNLESRLLCIHRRKDRSGGSPAADPRAPLDGGQPQGSSTSSLEADSGYQGPGMDDVSREAARLDSPLDLTSMFYSCGPFGLPADFVNSAWPLDLSSMEYNPADVFNYDALDFLNYSSNG